MLDKPQIEDGGGACLPTSVVVTPRGSAASIREATAADIPALAKLAAEVDGEVDSLVTRITATWSNWLVLVVEADEVIGLAAAERGTDLAGRPNLHLLHLYIRPQWRSFHLMRELIEELRRHGSVVWSLMEIGPAWPRLARRLGFTEIGRVYA